MSFVVEWAGEQKGNADGYLTVGRLGGDREEGCAMEELERQGEGM